MCRCVLTRIMCKYRNYFYIPELCVAVYISELCVDTGIMCRCQYNISSRFIVYNSAEFRIDMKYLPWCSLTAWCSIGHP